MGREVRKVPQGWRPKLIQFHSWITGGMDKRLQPMHARPFAQDMHDWYAGWQAWERGERASQASEAMRSMEYWEWAGPPPNPAFYMPDWNDAERTHLMMFETASEGTPISPDFETAEELARWLADNKADFRAGKPGTYVQWLKIVQRGPAPTTALYSQAPPAVAATIPTPAHTQGQTDP